MAKQRHTEGAFVSIYLKDGIFGFGRLLRNSNVGIYDYFSESESVIENLTEKPFLFEVAVFSDVISKSRWVKIGSRKMGEYILKDKFIQDVIDPDEFRIYNPNNGLMREALREECEGLNVAAVYEGSDIEEVLWEFYTTGRLDKWKNHNKII